MSHEPTRRAHTVLVVEDEQDLREMMRDALELNGYAVVTAEHGQDALAKIAEIEHLCVVILDLLMPVMNGWDFLAEDAAAIGARRRSRSSCTPPRLGKRPRASRGSFKSR